MRLLIFLLLITLLFTSCGNNSTPSGILPREKMGTIIWQLMQADEYVNNIIARDTTKTKVNSTEKMKKYQQVFDLNKTSMDEFKKSYQFYMTHPDITKIMFDSITAKATRERAELYKPKSDSLSVRANMERMQKEKHRTDSIAKVNMRQAKLKKPVSDTASKNKKPSFKLHRLKNDSIRKPLKKT